MWRGARCQCLEPGIKWVNLMGPFFPMWVSKNDGYLTGIRIRIMVTLGLYWAPCSWKFPYAYMHTCMFSYVHVCIPDIDMKVHYTCNSRGGSARSFLCSLQLWGVG